MSSALKYFKDISPLCIIYVHHGIRIFFSSIGVSHIFISCDIWNEM